MVLPSHPLTREDSLVALRYHYAGNEAQIQMTASKMCFVMYRNTLYVLFIILNIFAFNQFTTNNLNPFSPALLGLRPTSSITLPPFKQSKTYPIKT